MNREVSDSLTAASPDMDRIRVSSFFAPSYLDQSVATTDCDVESDEEKEKEVDYDWYERGLNRKGSTANRSFMSKLSFINRKNLKRFSTSKIAFIIMDFMVC
jgi:hypothetical protein